MAPRHSDSSLVRGESSIAAAGLASFGCSLALSSPGSFVLVTPPPLRPVASFLFVTKAAIAVALAIWLWLATWCRGVCSRSIRFFALGSLCRRRRRRRFSGEDAILRECVVDRRNWLRFGAKKIVDRSRDDDKALDRSHFGSKFGFSVVHDCLRSWKLLCDEDTCRLKPVRATNAFLSLCSLVCARPDAVT